MKKLFYIFSVALVMMTACSNGKGYTSVSVGEFAKVIADNQVQLIDTRTEAEFNEGHIPGAINIDVNESDFESKVGQKVDKNRPIALYCRGGRRSKIAAERIVALGYDDITELNTGFLSWTGEVEK
ncbi:MAG: rhodanese-like domain-containing protein [Alistipes sp.]|nr:rhodanese-like domain-containing protein [Alistipes sp.]